MSAYITLQTPMMDQECLIAALADVGFARSTLEVHPTASPLVGYEGDRRAQTAHIVIRRQHVGRASNDLGFLATDTGYRAIVSDYDRPRFGPDWLTELSTHYQTHWDAKRARLEAEERRQLEVERQRLVEAQTKAIYNRARALGYQVKETRDGQTIRLALLKRTY